LIILTKINKVRQLRLLVLLSWPWNAGIDLYSFSVIKQRIFQQNMAHIGWRAVHTFLNPHPQLLLPSQLHKVAQIYGTSQRKSAFVVKTYKIRPRITGSALYDIICSTHSCKIFVEVKRGLVYINNCATRWNTKQSVYYSESSHYTFRCQPHPLSEVHKTVTTASGTGHILCAANFFQRGQAWPCWREQHILLCAC